MEIPSARREQKIRGYGVYPLVANPRMTKVREREDGKRERRLSHLVGWEMEVSTDRKTGARRQFGYAFPILNGFIQGVAFQVPTPYVRNS